MYSKSPPEIDLSIVIPAFNEAGNLKPLIVEIAAALAKLGDPPIYEIIVVDDCSFDKTYDEAKAAMAECEQLRLIRHEYRGGKSAALNSGFRASRGRWVATLDGDGQNDPADLARCWSEVNSGPQRILYAGVRRRRNDGVVKLLTSRFANKVRRALLDDGTRDTGCGFKILPQSLIDDLPYFDNMHRFLPALARCNGCDVKELSINDRARQHGQSKYGFFDRASVALLDVIGVFWLKRRKYRAGEATEIIRGK